MSKIHDIFEKNPLAWGFYYFPHHFRQNSPPFHHKILTESMKHKLFAVAAPRGSAKSTLLDFLKASHKICFKKAHFIVIVQNTFEKAAGSLETIKTEFKDNTQLMSDFPITILKDKIGDTVFEHKDGFRTRIMCRGAEQIGGIRGEKFGAYRPDYIIIDDLEDDIMVRSPEGRENIRELFDKALMKAVDEAEEYDIDVIGTLLHDDCLIARLVNKKYYKDWRKLLYRAKYKNNVTKDWASLWPEKWTLPKLEKMEKDDPTTFAQEMQNDPVSGLLSKFQKEDFRRWYIENNDYLLIGELGNIISRGALSSCKVAIGCDLAWEEKKENDESVIMPCYITPDSDILIDTYINQKGMKPDMFEAFIFPMVEKYMSITGKDVPIGFEKAALEKVMKWFLKQAMRRRNKFLTLKDVDWPADKISRLVSTLQPRYKQHTIYHKKGMGDLEYQLLRIPSGTHEDLCDALRVAVRLLEHAPNKPKNTIKSEDEGFDWLRNQILKQNPYLSLE